MSETEAEVEQVSVKETETPVEEVKSEAEVETKDQVLELTRNFRDKFKEVIKDFELLSLHHEYKYNFFPNDLLKGESKGQLVLSDLP